MAVCEQCRAALPSDAGVCPNCLELVPHRRPIAKSFTLSGLVFLILIALAIPGLVMFAASSGKVSADRTRLDVSLVAGAEFEYEVAHGTYTNSASELPAPNLPRSATVALFAAYTGAVGFCVVGNMHGSHVWYLESNETAQAAAYSSQGAAEAACPVPAVGHFALVN